MVSVVNSGYNIDVRKGQAGYSLIELMIAIALISGVALLISQFSVSFNNQSTDLRRSCESHGSSLIGVIQEETPYREILNFFPRGAGVANRLPPNFSSGTRAVPLAATYAPTASELPFFYINKQASDAPVNPAHTANGGGRLQSFQLIQGSIKTLATIYNRTPAVRCQFGTYAPITSNAMPLPSSFLNLQGPVTIRMRIDPYRISNGQNLCGVIGANPAFPSPRGNVVGSMNALEVGSGGPDTLAYPAAYQNAYSQVETLLTGSYSVNDVRNANSSIATHVNVVPGVPGGDPDLGLRMTVEITYPSEGQNYSCQASQNFEYPVDRSEPAPPTAVVELNTAAPATGIWNLCSLGSANPPRSLRIRIGYAPGAGPGQIPLANAEPGVQFMCKDLSAIRNANALKTPATPCYRTGDGDGGGIAHIRPAVIATGTPYMTATNFLQANYTIDKTLRSRNWVLCDRLPICGVTPSSVVATAGPNNVTPANDKSYTLTYDNLPLGCNVNLEVVAVDTAGNRSPAASPAFLTLEQQNFVATNGQPVSRRTNEVYHPTCGAPNNPNYVSALGTFCPPDATWAPSGYYTCRAGGCCVGAGCRPWN